MGCGGNNPLKSLSQLSGVPGDFTIVTILIFSGNLNLELWLGQGKKSALRFRPVEFLKLARIVI